MKVKERINYSPLEAKLLLVLTNKPQPISKISERLYADAERVPLYDRETIRNTLTRLSGKIAKNREKFSIWKTPARGPHEIEYWVE